MMDDTTTVSVERRAKKYVKAPVHRWFAVCAPGLESVLRLELSNLGFDVRPDMIHGGVEFDGKLEHGMSANLRLRTATRILLRIADFRVRAPEDLFREAVAIPWEAYLPANCAPGISAVVHGSRLNSRTLVESTLDDAIRRRFADLALPARDDIGSHGQTVFARMESDRMTLSLDSSGELLHRRGWRTESVAAPVRETLAAAILLHAGFKPGMNLVDGMCGSGTLAIEAALISAGIWPGTAAPNPRRFSFMDWPAFSRPAWDHMCKAAATDAGMANGRIFARDIDREAIRATTANADNAGVSGIVNVDTVDFFESTPPCPPGLLVLNPPYGLRLDRGSDILGMYRKIARMIENEWAGWGYAVIVPDQDLARRWPLSTETTIRFMHGGLRAVALIGARPWIPD